MKKIAILTGGGDCPGLNAAIRAVVQSATLEHQWEVLGIPEGFKGLMENKFIELNLNNTFGILSKGGTILGSSNKDTPFKVPTLENGKKVYKDLSDICLESLRKKQVDALVVVGGDGTLAIAHQFSLKGLKVIGIPKTIDNDLNGTEFTIGFFSAIDTAVDAIDKLHTTAEAHQRIMVVEVMGRYAGWIALFSGLGGDADCILIPEIPFDLEKVSKHLFNLYSKGKKYSLIVVSEGARPIGKDYFVQRVVEDSPDQIRLGGVGHFVANELEKLTKKETRAIVLGHLLRGGIPSGFDRVLASRLGVAAVKACAEGKFGNMISYKHDSIELVSLETGAGKNRFVDKNSHFLKAAKSRGIIFGD